MQAIQRNPHNRAIIANMKRGSHRPQVTDRAKYPARPIVMDRQADARSKRDRQDRLVTPFQV